MLHLVRDPSTRYHIERAMVHGRYSVIKGIKEARIPPRSPICVRDQKCADAGREYACYPRGNNINIVKYSGRGLPILTNYRHPYGHAGDRSRGLSSRTCALCTCIGYSTSGTAAMNAAEANESPPFSLFTCGFPLIICDEYCHIVTTVLS